MKKKFFAVMLCALISVGLVTGCGKESGSTTEAKDKKDTTSSESGKSTKNASYDELIDMYERAYNEENIDLLYDIFPDFMFEQIKKYLTIDSLKQSKSYYGDNAKMTINVTDAEKMNAEWLEMANEELKAYGNDAKVTECYELKGTITYSGSDDTDTDDIDGEIYYCNYKGEWKLIAS